MRAWTYNRRGPLEDILHLQHDFPQPTPSDLRIEEVLIEASHVTLTAANANLISVFPHLNEKPKIPEHRFAGKIISIAAGTSTAFAIGNKVFGMINPKKGGYGGVLTEYIVVPIDAVVRKPEGMTGAEASGLGGSGSTAIHFAERAGLIDIIEDEPGPRIVNKAEGKRVLVTAGNTSLGQFMVQFARFLVGMDGLVVSTASLRSEKLVVELGAHKIIDYTSIPSLHGHLLQNYSSPDTMFDAIFDIAGSDPRLYPRCSAYLKEDGFFVFGGNVNMTHIKPSSGRFGAIVWILGLIVSVIGWVIHMFRPVALGGVPRQCAFISGTPSQQNLRLVRQLVEEGVLRSIVDSEWNMEDLIKAYQHLARGPTSGKVVVKI